MIATVTATRKNTYMYLIVIGWLYVALMMAVAEATHSGGTILGAVISFFLYGLGPVALVVYLMGAPGRGRAIKARDAAERDAAAAAAAGALSITPLAMPPLSAPSSPPGEDAPGAPDAGREAAAEATVAAVRKEQ